MVQIATVVIVRVEKIVYLNEGFQSFILFCFIFHHFAIVCILFMQIIPSPIYANEYSNQTFQMQSRRIGWACGTFPTCRVQVHVDE